MLPPPTFLSTLNWSSGLTGGGLSFASSALISAYTKLRGLRVRGVRVRGVRVRAVEAISK